MGRRNGPSRPARAAAAVAAIAVGALAAGCTGGPGDASAPRPSPRLVARSNALDALSLRIAGDARVRYDVAYAGYRLVQDPVTDCMTSAGLDYTPPHFPPMPAGLTVPAGRGNWLSPLGDTRGSGAERILRQVQDGVPAAPRAGARGLPPRRTRAYDAQLEFCREIRPQANVWPGYPALHDRLAADLAELLRPVEEEVGRTYGGGYARCMAGRGYDLVRLGYDDTDPDELSVWLEHRYPTDPAEVPLSGGAGGPAWRAAVGAERAAARADAACRAAAYWAGIRLLGPRLDRFVAAHRAELAELDRQYAGLDRRVPATAESP